MKKLFIPVMALIAILLIPNFSFCQDLPDEMHFSDSGRRLLMGDLATQGFYEANEIQVLELWFGQANYWSLLTSNYQSGTDLGALMIVNGDTLESEVGVRFKGQTSYLQTQNSQKKSFNIALDFEDPEQDYKGYETFNLSNGFEDPSFLREVLYLQQGKLHTPSLKGNYVHLFINGQNWGIYPNVQQLNSDYLKEWFLSSDGTRWRALRTDATGGGPGGPGGGLFGTGVSSLNYLGADTALYVPKYTLKTTHKEHPWEDLLNTCDVLNNTPLNSLEDSIYQYMDLDRVLWTLAREIMFSDDDSYVHKGGMDYYLYWESETGRMVNLEYDGNSIMKSNAVNWSPFYNEDDDRYPLMNRLFAVPEIRQRYLAHFRTMLEESFQPDIVFPIIDANYELIDSLVQEDPKKIYTYAQFISEKQSLKNNFQQRYNLLQSNIEVNQQGLDISEVNYASPGGQWVAPSAGEEVSVNAQISGAAGIENVALYYGTGLVGVFQKTPMFDDGAHDDGAAGDGVFGAIIPAHDNGTYIRFYIEAIANNTQKTATYMPKGAEHDVYIYQVKVTEYIDSEVVVNEIMASNSTTVADQDGEYEDWIEFYNKSSDAVDLSGWFLTDNITNLQKWAFPEGTIVGGNGYLIVWADEDGSQAGLHTNFKLSATGEALYLLDPEIRIAQEIIFDQQETDMGYARIPNGTGDFVIKGPTFGINNETVNAAYDIENSADFVVFPNPVGDLFFVKTDRQQVEQLDVFDSYGRLVYTSQIQGLVKVVTNDWSSGVYIVKIGGGVKRVIVK